MKDILHSFNDHEVIVTTSGPNPTEMHTYWYALECLMCINVLIFDYCYRSFRHYYSMICITITRFKGVNKNSFAYKITQAVFDYTLATISNHTVLLLIFFIEPHCEEHTKNYYCSTQVNMIIIRVLFKNH